MAILVSLGATKRKSLGPYFVQLFILGIIAVIPAGLICMLLVPILSGTLSSFVPVQVNAKLNIGSVGLAIVVATIGGWLIALPNFGEFANCNQLNYFASQKTRASLFTVNFLYFLAYRPFWHFGFFAWHKQNLQSWLIYFFFCLLGSVIVLYILVRFGLILIEKSLVNRIFKFVLQPVPYPETVPVPLLAFSL